MLRALRQLRARLPLRVICVWLSLILFFSLFSRRPRFVEHDNPSALTVEAAASSLVHLPPLRAGEGDRVIDAVVFISMGDMARDSLIDYAIASVRKAGKWTGPIYVLTDSPSCFTRAKADYGIKVVNVPKKASLMQIKALKPQLLDLVPAHVDALLYLDVDIVVTRELDYFLNMVGREVLVHSPRAATDGSSAPGLVPANGSQPFTPPAPQPFDFAAFGDAKGHYVGFCAGCEKWHTGVLILRRGQGRKCLQAWAEILSSGRYGTDQESLDRAERSGACTQTHMLPSGYLLFAKDYLGGLLTTGHTFVHVTSAARRGEEGGFYKGWVVPRLRSGLEDRVDPGILTRAKTC